MVLPRRLTDNLMASFDYYVVDAFTSLPFQGNPAGVVPAADGLTDEQMRAIASEINLSETAFVLKPTTADADIRIRWFTPQVEMQMCGHATLATAHVLRELGRWNDISRPVRIETASGVLAVDYDPAAARPIFWLHMPTPRLVRPVLDPTAVTDACRIDFANIVVKLPLMVSQDRDLIVPVKNHLVLQAAQPDFAALADICVRNNLRGVCLTTREAVSQAISLQSRFFAPAVGINEDPVTGSVHGPLGLYLLLYHLVPLTHGEAILPCLQTPASGRVGMVRVWLRQELDGPLASVKVGGECLTTMRGQIYVEAAKS